MKLKTPESSYHLITLCEPLQKQKVLMQLPTPKGLNFLSRCSFFFLAANGSNTQLKIVIWLYLLTLCWWISSDQPLFSLLPPNSSIDFLNLDPLLSSAFRFISLRVSFYLLLLCLYTLLLFFFTCHFNNYRNSNFRVVRWLGLRKRFASIYYLV